MVALKVEGEGGCTFNSLIEVTPPMFNPMCQQASCLRREDFPYVLPAAPTVPVFNTPTPSASMSAPPSILAPSALARPDPDPVFVKTSPLVSPVLVSPVTIPASFFNKTARPLAPAPVTSAADRTSCLSASQLASAQLQPALKTRSFLVPAPTGIDPIAHLANITGIDMSSASDIDTVIEGCQFKTIADSPFLSHHPAQPLLQYLATSGFPAAVGKPWSLAAIREAIKKGPLTPTRNSASTIFCRKELADRVS